MDEISLLPQMLREQSLSHREIVLPYQEAKEALDLLRRAQWAVWGWEGWVKYLDGSHGFASGGVMGADIQRKEEKPGLTHGKVTSDGLKPHGDLLAEFPFLGLPNP